MGIFANIAEWVATRLHSLPLILVLLVGGWLCISNRRRRPRVSLVLGVVVAFELARHLGLWAAICRGVEAFGYFVLASANFIRYPEAWHASVLIWGGAIWAGLCLDDRGWLAKPEKPLQTKTGQLSDKQSE